MYVSQRRTSRSARSARSASRQLAFPEIIKNKLQNKCTAMHYFIYIHIYIYNYHIYIIKYMYIVFCVFRVFVTDS